MNPSTTLLSRSLSLSMALGSSAMLLMTACGGRKQNPNQPPTAIKVIPEGIWEGKVKTEGKVENTVLATLADGTMMLHSEAAGSPMVMGRFKEGRSSAHAFTLKGRHPLTVTVAAHEARSKVELHVTTGQDSNRCTFDKYRSSYDAPLALASLARTYTSKAEENSLEKNLTVVLDAQGRISGTVDGSSLEGKLTVADPAKAGIRAEVTLTPHGQGAQKLDGLALLNPGRAGAPGQSLVIGVHNSSLHFYGTFR